MNMDYQNQSLRLSQVVFEFLSIVMDKKPIEKADYLHLQEAILTYIDEYGSIRNKEARKILNKAESTSKRFLNTMVQEGLLEAIGEKRQRIYVKKKSSLLTTSHRRKK